MNQIRPHRARTQRGRALEEEYLLFLQAEAAEALLAPQARPRPARPLPARWRALGSTVASASAWPRGSCAPMR
jgi:hypothetical protein